MLWWRKHPLPALVETYRRGTPRSVSAKTMIAEITFVALDCETSGFDAASDRILSLATAEIRNGRLLVARAGAWMVQQERRALTPATSVHGILPSDTAAGEPEKNVLLELLPRIEGAVIVGHHIGFDVMMLNAAMRRHFHTELRNPVLDTAAFAMDAVEAFARTAYPGQREPGLEEVCAQCGIPMVERHTADGDTFTTATLFLTLCARRQRQLGRPLKAGDLPLKRS